jgi:hypothetical protein
MLYVMHARCWIASMEQSTTLAWSGMEHQGMVCYRDCALVLILLYQIRTVMC